MGGRHLLARATCLSSERVKRRPANDSRVFQNCRLRPFRVAVPMAPYRFDVAWIYTSPAAAA